MLERIPQRWRHSVPNRKAIIVNAITLEKSIARIPLMEKNDQSARMFNSPIMCYISFIPKNTLKVARQGGQPQHNPVS